MWVLRGHHLATKLYKHCCLHKAYYAEQRFTFWGYSWKGKSTFEHFSFTRQICPPLWLIRVNIIVTDNIFYKWSVPGHKCALIWGQGNNLNSDYWFNTEKGFKLNVVKNIHILILLTGIYQCRKNGFISLLCSFYQHSQWPLRAENSHQICREKRNRQSYL